MTPQPRLLVTGAGGRIGRRLRAWLESNGVEGSYVVSHRFGARSDDSLADAVDITDSARLREVVTQRKPTTIIHLASVAGGACETDPTLAAAVNVDAVRTLAEIGRANGVRRFVLASTSAVYGDQYGSPIAETGPIDIGSRYADTKRQAELALAEVADGSDYFSAVALRIFNVYGPGMVKSLANSLLEATADSPVTLAGLDTFIRDYIHVDDVVQALIRAAEATLPTPWLISNAGTGRATSNRDLVAMLSPVQFAMGEPRSSYSCADTSVAKSVLGFAASRELSRSSVM